jgi:hypothetical protein
VSGIAFSGVGHAWVAFDHKSVDDEMYGDMGCRGNRPARELLRARVFVVLHSIVVRMLTSGCFVDCHEGEHIKEG